MAFTQGTTFTANAPATAADQNGAWDELESYLDGSLPLAELENGANKNFVVCNASGVPQYVAMSGDATISNTGVLTLGAGVVDLANLDPVLQPVFGVLPGVELTSSVDQAIADNTTTALSWNVEVSDSSGMHFSGLPSRITITTQGFYAVTATVSWGDTFAAGKCLRAAILGAGGTRVAVDGRISGGNGDEPDINLAAVTKLAAADYLEVSAFHDAGVSKDVEGGVNNSHFSAHWLGTG